jgi:probable rRNA maturation factor
VNHRIPVKWIKKAGQFVLREESWSGSGMLSIVLVDDSEIQKLNNEFLGKAFPTDVIAFPFPDAQDEIWGEIYISVDRAREQAKQYRVSYLEELVRLVIHGILHLLGYNDQIESDRKKMKEKEDCYLSCFLDAHGSLRSAFQ